MSARPSSLRAFAAIAWSLTAGMVLFGAINVGIALWLNIWNRDFFNALEKRDTAELAELLYVLAAIVVSGGVAVAIHLHVRRRLQIKWRTWLTHVTTRRWRHAGRQYQLGLLADDLDNRTAASPRTSASPARSACRGPTARRWLPKPRSRSSPAKGS